MANTPMGYPYQLGTDRVMDGDDIIHELADAIDLNLGLMASGSGIVTVSTVGVPGNVTITFPAGRFTGPPHVVCAILAANPQQWNSSVGGVTATSFILYAVRSSGSVPTNQAVHWLAQQTSG